MFWALQKHLEWRKQMREEGRAELRPELERQQAVLTRVAREKGLTLAELMAQEERR